MNIHEFPGAPETASVGNDYEHLLAACFALRFALDKDVKNFKISGNNNDLGLFDDIVLEVEYENDVNKIFALQLKHIQNAELSAATLNSKDSGNFSLRKYSKTFEDIKSKLVDGRYYDTNFENIYLILVTNAKLPPLEKYGPGGKKEAVKKKPLMSRSDINIIAEDVCIAKNLLNCSDSSQNFIFTFEINNNPELNEFFKHFLLYTQQKNAKFMSKVVCDHITEHFKVTNNEIAHQYIDFMKCWWRGDFGIVKLQRNDVRQKLSELLLIDNLPKINLNNFEANFEMSLMLEIIQSFNISLLRNDAIKDQIYSMLFSKISNIINANVESLTDPIFDIENIPLEFPLVAKGVIFKKLSFLNLYVMLWHINHVPLFIQITKENQDLIMKALDLCRHDKKKSFIVLTDMNLNLSNEWKVFSDLSDLKQDSSLFKNLTNNLTLSLQNRTPINLETFIKQDGEFSTALKFHHIVLMMNKSLNIGSYPEVLPKHYITRCISKIFVHFSIFNETDKDIFIIIYNAEQNIEKLLDLKCVILHSVDSIDNTSSIYLIQSELSLDEFSKINFETISKNCHLLKLFDEEKLEWLHTLGSLELIRVHQHKTFNNIENNSSLVISDKEIESYCRKEINIISGEAGIGKSMVIEFLMKNSPSNYWNVKINAYDCMKYLENHSKSPVTLLTTKAMDPLANFSINSYFKRGKVRIFWDSLDEIPQNLLPQMIERMKIYQQQGCQQWIATRPNLLPLLESTFGTIAHDIYHFSKINQVDYILQCYNEKFPADTGNYEIVQKLSNEIDKILKSDYMNQSGFPLLIHMLTDIFLSDLERYTNHLEVIKITDIYEYFLDERFNELFNRAFGDKVNHQVNRLKGLFKETLMDQYRSAAMKYIFPKPVVEELNINCDKTISEYKKGVNHLGIISGISDDNVPLFSHRSYAEFLASSWLALHGEKYASNIEEKISDNEFFGIKFMLDLLTKKVSK